MKLTTALTLFAVTATASAYVVDPNGVHVRIIPHTIDPMPLADVFPPVDSKMYRPAGAFFQQAPFLDNERVQLMDPRLLRTNQMVGQYEDRRVLHPEREGTIRTQTHLGTWNADERTWRFPSTQLAPGIPVVHAKYTDQDHMDLWKANKP